MVDDSRRKFPRSLLQADTIVVSCGLANFECTSWSTQRCHKFWGLRDELGTTADYDKFLESSEDNFPGVSDGRSVWMIDCRKLDHPDCDKNPRILVGRNPRIRRSTMGSKDYIELQEWTSSFSCERRVVVEYVDSPRWTPTLRSLVALL